MLPSLPRTTPAKKTGARGSSPAPTHPAHSPLFRRGFHPSSLAPSLPPSSVILPRPFYLPPQRAPGVGGDEGRGGGSAPTATQRFHLLSAGPPASRKEGVAVAEGEERRASSCSDAAQRQRYHTMRAHLFMILRRHVLQSDPADWGEVRNVVRQPQKNAFSSEGNAAQFMHSGKNNQRNSRNVQVSRLEFNIESLWKLRLKKLSNTMLASSAVKQPMDWCGKLAHMLKKKLKKTSQIATYG